MFRCGFAARCDAEGAELWSARMASPPPLFVEIVRAGLLVRPRVLIASGLFLPGQWEKSSMPVFAVLKKLGGGLASACGRLM